MSVSKVKTVKVSVEIPVKRFSKVFKLCLKTFLKRFKAFNLVRFN